MENNHLSPFFPLYNTLNRLNNNYNISKINTIPSYGLVIIPVSKNAKHIRFSYDLINYPIQIYTIRTSVVNTSIEILQNSLKWKNHNDYSTTMLNLTTADLILALYDISKISESSTISDGTLIGFASVSIQLKKISRTNYAKYLHINRIYINHVYTNANPNMQLINIIKYIALNNNLYKVTINIPFSDIPFYTRLGFTIIATNNMAQMSINIINTDYDNIDYNKNNNYIKR